MNDISKVVDLPDTAENSDFDDSNDSGQSVGRKAADILSSVITFLLSAAIIAAALVFAFNNSPTKSIFGFRYYTVLTPSMTPTYDVGDVVFVKLTPPENINVNDVITFNPSANSDAYLTHRVSEKYDDYEGTGVICFRTKGDANNSDDSFLIDGDRVIGVVKFGIPKIGYVIRFVQLRWYFVVPLVIMLFVLVHFMRVYFDDDDSPETDTVV